jgi:exodeoxyribonuclease V alpha subunit
VTQEQLALGGTLTLRVTVADVIYRSADERYGVLDAETGSPPKRITLVGDLATISPGESLSVQGRWRTHKQYGERFHVDSYAPITPSTRQGIERYLGSGLVSGVGPAMAARLVERFGDETLDVVVDQPHRLREVSGIGPRRAQAIAAAVRERREEAATMSWLHGLGLGPGMAKRLRHRYGSETARVVKDDPYLVSEEVAGIGFATADRIGKALGYTDDDPRRAAGAVLHLVGKAADEGHVFIKRDELMARAELLEVDYSRASEALDTLAQQQLIVVEGDAVYAPPLHEAEVNAAQRLITLTREREVPKGASAAVQQATQSGFSDAQRAAVQTSLEHGLLVLTGGPGTGKTTTVRAIVDAHQRVGRRMTLCAPTGRAARRLAEATGNEAFTIHRLLEYNPATQRFGRNADDPLRADVVLVDEASMLDLQLAAALLDAVRPEATLVLVGDVDQLPPVGPGPTLREIIDSDMCPVVRLQEVFRQAQRSAIVRAAHAILRGERPTPTESDARGEGDLFIVRSRDPEVICVRVQETLERIRSAYGLDPAHDVQVVTPMRRGRVGTEKLNELVRASLNPASVGRAGLHRHDKVMQLRNDYERDVFNGDIGEVVAISADGSVLVEMNGRGVRYDREAAEGLALAYACTVHKVQGSEFPGVIVALHAGHHVLLNRALIYTAITRARKLAVIVGDDRALDRAIANTSPQRTNSNLATRLRAAAQRG